MDDQPITHKFVAILNQKIPVGLLMNALGHMSAGLSAFHPDKEKLRFDSYIDANGNSHQSISDNPFIVLSADNSNQIRTLRETLVEAGVVFVDFTNTMTVGTYKDQKERTRQTPENQLEYYGIAMFGPIDQLNSFTKKFSLWR